MNFEIENNILLEKITTVAYGLAKNTPMKVLECIKIECIDDTIYLTTLNDICCIEVVIYHESLKIKENGKVLVDGLGLLNLIKTYDSGLVNLYLTDNNQLCVQNLRNTSHLNISDASDFPTVEFISTLNPFELDVRELIDGINQTTFACNNTSGPQTILNGVNFRLLGNELTLTATNAYRLSERKIKVTNHDNMEFNLTITAKALEELTKCLNSFIHEESINLYFDNQKILFKLDTMHFQTRMLDGNYPDTSSVIPRNMPKCVRFEKDALQKTLRTASVMSNSQGDEKGSAYNPITLTISNTNEVKFTSSNDKGNSASKITPLDLKIDEPLVISFSSKYLQDALKVLDSKEVCLNFKTANNPFTVTNPEDNSLIELILPFKSAN